MSDKPPVPPEDLDLEDIEMPDSRNEPEPDADTPSPEQGDPAPEPAAQETTDPAAALDPAAETEEAPPPDPDAPAPEAPTAADGAPPAGDVAPPEPEPEAGSPEPFHFKVYGTDVQVPGAEVRGDRITVPREAWEKVIQPRLVDPTAVQARIRELSTESRKAKALVDVFEQLAKEPDEVTAVERFLKFRTEIPARLKDAEIEALRARVDPESQPAEPEEVVAAVDTAAHQLLDHALDHYLALPELKDLGLDRTAIRELLVASDTKTFSLGERDARGVPTVHLNTDFVSQVLLTQAAPIRKVREQMKKLERPVASAPARRPPPGIPTSGVPSKAKQETAPKSWDEVMASVDDIDL